ncbi:hypothetical protein K438DRAFT_1863218 [Mycena galopus ATCC 62051]|nr:hypothetical protein K438DRAFT_1863218 [Mycena galopus ATCC 62051]
MTQNYEAELPFELHSKIFLYCLPPDGRICRQWRAIALGTPQLWSSIFFEFSEESSYGELPLLFGYDVTLDATTALVELWLMRSGGYPLSITVRCPESGVRLRPGLMGALKSASTRWERLELMLSSLDLSALNDLSGPFPCLRHVAIEINDNPLEEFSQTSAWTKLYNHAPRLSVLHIGSSVSEKYTFIEHAPSTPLTTLGCSIEVSALAVVALNYFPGLRHLVLYVGSVAEPLVASRTPATMHIAAHLRCLILKGQLDLLDHHLGANIWTVEDSNTIVSFVARSKCVLARLTIRHVFMEPDAWVALLPVVITLPILELRDTSFMSSGEESLLPPETFLPRLQMLCIVGYYNRSLYNGFVQILQTGRAPPRARLRVLSQERTAPPPPAPSVLACLQDLATAGMDITLQTPTYTWPAESRDDMEEDYNIFNPGDPLPFHDW